MTNNFKLLTTENNMSYTTIYYILFIIAIIYYCFYL